MITLQDCIDMSELEPEIVAAIAQHEHLPAIVAAEMGSWLACTPDGLATIRRFIEDDLLAARRCGDARRQAELEAALARWCRGHPDTGPLLQ